MELDDICALPLDTRQADYRRAESLDVVIDPFAGGGSTIEICKKRFRRYFVSDRTIRDWLSRIDKDSKEARNKRIAELWLACHTNQQIADVVGIPKGTVDGICLELAELPESSKPAAMHLTDFTPPIYNIWKQQTKSEGSSHFGNSEVRWVDNLLYLDPTRFAP